MLSQSTNTKEVTARGVIAHESISNNAKCPGGCCPESECESGSFCASTLEECPQYPEVRGVITKGVIKKDVLNLKLISDDTQPYPNESFVKNLGTSQNDIFSLLKN